MNTLEDKKRNHATIYSGDGTRILAEQDGTKSRSYYRWIRKGIV